MTRALVATLLLAGCGTSGAGQKVTVLLLDREISCESKPDGSAKAYLQLSQPEDLYQAEFVNAQTGVVRTLEGLREDLVVTFTCPDGVDGFWVRHATVLQAKQEQVVDGADDGGGGTAPP